MSLEILDQEDIKDAIAQVRSDAFPTRWYGYHTLCVGFFIICQFRREFIPHAKNILSSNSLPKRRVRCS